MVLYGTQGGDCNGCGTHLFPRCLAGERVLVSLEGGVRCLDGVRLVCGCCDALEGHRPMEDLRARLVRGMV